MKKKIIYHDELNDDFATTKLKKKKLDKNYSYVNRNIVYQFFAFIFYRLIATPIALLYCKVAFKIKIVNARAVRKCKTGCYIYGNHTQSAGDAFIPNIITFPKYNYIVVGTEAVSIPVVKHLVKMAGGIPLPESLAQGVKFLSALTKRTKQKAAVTIYPEAHIWPYYTKIRPFKSGSFKYPVYNDLPSFCFTTTYSRNFFGRIVATVYVDGPFYPDKTLSPKQAEIALRDEIYYAMNEKALRYSTYEKYEYVKEETPDEGGLFDEELQDEENGSCRAI